MQIKENIKVPRHWPLCGEFTGTGEFPAQMASNAENVSIWWRYHELFGSTENWMGDTVSAIPLCQFHFRYLRFHTHDCCLWAWFSCFIAEVQNHSYCLMWTNSWWLDVTHFGRQPDEPLAYLVTTNRIINAYGFLVVMMLLMYSVLHCLYSVGTQITTTTSMTLCKTAVTPVR